MKHKLYTILTLTLGYSTLSPLDDYTNHTYMFVRPVYNSISIEQASWHNLVYNKKSKGSAFQVTAIYEQSYENLYNSAYFLFNMQNQITISAGTETSYNPLSSGQFPTVDNPLPGQIGVKTLERDVLGQWIGINSGQDFFLELHPTSKQACVMLEASQDLKHFLSFGIFENWSLNVSAPVSWIENNLGVRGDTNVVEAFNSPGYQYVTMPSGDRSSVRVPQVNIWLGTKYMSENDVQVHTSTGVIVPLVEQPCGGSLFQPIQGFNSHFGFDTMVHFQFPIVKKTPDAPSRILMFADIHNIFLSRNHQLRTYDIRKKPFSRYMQLLDRETNQLVPAMNVLTLRSRVEPFNVVNFATGFRFAYHDCFGEIGYELWAHGSEVITPAPKVGQPLGSWQDDRYGIPFINTEGQPAQIDTLTGNVEPQPVTILAQTASESTINYIAGPDGQFTCCPTPTFVQKNKYLTLLDLDRVTCAARSTITHRAFLSFSFGTKGKRQNSFANFGAFIEAAQNNAALCFWGGWFKAGLTF